MSVYYQYPDLDAKIWDIKKQIANQFCSGSPNRKEITRLRLKCKRLEQRKLFDHTMLINWIILGFGIVALAGCLTLLKVIGS
jgi:hypothetical protein